MRGEFMKKFAFLFFALVCFSVSASPAQDISQFNAVRKDNSGLYVSLSDGVLFGKASSAFGGVHITTGECLESEITYSGIGNLIDLKIGGEVFRNFMLHATFIYGFVNEPSTDTIIRKSAGNSILYRSRAYPDAISETIFGIGATYYFSQYDIFISFSAGNGYFGISNVNETTNTDYGLGFQAQAGKEWRINENWGVGASLSYIQTNGSSELCENWRSDRYAVQVRATFK